MPRSEDTGVTNFDHLAEYLARVTERDARAHGDEGSVGPNTDFDEAMGIIAVLKASQADVEPLVELLKSAKVGLRACGYIHGSAEHHCHSCRRSLADLTRIARKAMEKQSSTSTKK